MRLTTFQAALRVAPPYYQISLLIMTLGQKQRLFARLVAHLINHAYALGYEISLGHAYRSLDECKRLGFANSNHGKKLAIDLNLFKDGRYLRSTDSHRQLGDFWESLHPLCRWGGRFNDGNHYSLEHNGVK